jgi:DNA-binding response OmpR family regulator
MHCIHCGQTITPLNLTVQTNEVAANGLSIRIPDSVAVLISRLKKDAPRPVILSALINELWGLRDEPESSDNIVAVYMCKARKALRPLGYDIESIRASYFARERSYRLVPHDSAHTSARNDSTRDSFHQPCHQALQCIDV